MNKLAAVLLLFSLTSLAEPGDYDPTFGTGGVKKFNFNSDPAINESSYGVALGPAGTYYLTSNNAAINGDYFWQLSRHLPDGSLDTSFSFDGIATANFNLPNNGLNDQVRHIYVQNDGKILLAGSAELGSGNGHDVAIARFNTDGTLDASFSADGKTTIQLSNDPNRIDHGFMVKTDTLGKVLISVGTNDSSGPAVIRLLPNGQPDNSFNLTGKIQLNINGLVGNATFIEAVAGNKILVAGSVDVDGAGNYDFFAARLNNNGSFDTTFNATGFRIIPIDIMPNQADLALTGLLTDNQQLFIAGASKNNGDDDFSVIGLNPDGSMINNFGFNGIVVVTISSNYDAPFGMTYQEDGKLLLCGYTTIDGAGTYKPTIVRLNPDGSQDFDFGDFGVAILDADPQSPNDFPGLFTSCVIDDNQFLVTSGYLANLNNSDHMVSLSRIDLGLDLIFKNSFE